MADHTPEPWHTDVRFLAHGKERQTRRSVRAANDVILFTFGKQALADVHRAVVCVNACAGIPTESLERLPSRVKTALELAAAPARLDAATELLRRWVQLNDTPCRWDHNGDCQEHYMENDTEGCTVKETRDFLEAGR